MPNVTAIPRTMSNGDVVTQFLDTVSTSSVTYTFSAVQEKLTVTNKGPGTFQVTVNGTTLTVFTGSYKEFTGRIDFFSIVSTAGLQSFEAVARYTPDSTEVSPASTDKIVTFGDSLTAGTPQFTRSYPTWLSYSLGIPVINKGIWGNMSADLLNRVSTDVIAFRPSICIVMIGTNDINNGVPNSTLTSNMATITNTLLDNGIKPIWCTIPPRSDKPELMPTIRKINSWLVVHCQTQGIALADVYTTMANADGTPKTGYLLPDGLHQTSTGQRAIATALSSIVPKANRNIPWRFAGDVENMIPNGTFTTDTNADGVGDSWSALGNAGGLLTYSRAAHPTDGQWQVITKAAGASQQTGGVQCTGLNTFVAGRTYRVECDIDFSAGAVETLAAYLQCLDSGNNLIGSYFFLLQSAEVDTVTNTRFFTNMTVPAGTVSVGLIVYGFATTAYTLKIGRVRAFELFSTP